ncbi:MAG: hypothetical protein JNM99_21180 [Verrucomicrobiaceae bacterium]|nr:hypothetical protein [Verrucomicrobiaceae bacterium]
MNPDDEKELHRLSELLHDIERTLTADAPQREALVKASLALGMIFLQDARGEIERIYEGLEQPAPKTSAKPKTIKPARTTSKKAPSKKASSPAKKPNARGRTKARRA